MFEWTEARIATLRECVAAGHSSGRTAATLTRQTGEPITRSATLGKAFRLGIRFNSVLSGMAEKPQPRRRRNTRHSEKTLAQHVGERLPPVDFTPDPASIDAGAIPAGQRVSLLELTNFTCRFPYGDPGDASFFFCGARTADNAVAPYCPFHSRIAYRSSKPQQGARAA